jgi:OOP family OmpA-OmpF porin
MVAAVTPIAPSEFIIYFGYDKCNITADADKVLAEAASAAKANGSASVRIVAHTDSMGSDSYNQKLSDCRAEATKGNLVSKGVLVGSILTLGKGESELLVSTGDQVKEPQNRRATINVSEATTN